MAKKKSKKNKLGKILAAGAALAGLGAMMRNRGDRGLQFVGQDMTTGMLPTGDARVAENIANFDMGMSRIADAGGVANLRKEENQRLTNGLVQFSKDCYASWRKDIF